MYKILFIIIIFIIIFIIDFINVHDTNKCSFTNIYVHNELCSYNDKIYSNMINLYKLNLNLKLKILEIGAGSGNSSTYFINYFNNKNVNFNYTICEIDKLYFNNLKKLVYNNNNKKIDLFFNSWEKLNNNYDLIITTVFSSVNVNNYKKFKNLCNNNTKIISIVSIFSINKIDKFKFKLIYKKRISLFFYIIIFKI